MEYTEEFNCILLRKGDKDQPDVFIYITDYENGLFEIRNNECGPFRLPLNNIEELNMFSITHDPLQSGFVIKIKDLEPEFYLKVLNSYHLRINLSLYVDIDDFTSKLEKKRVEKINSILD